MAKEPSRDRRPFLPPLLLRRADQLVVATLVLGGLVAMVAWYATQGGFRGRMVELEHVAPLAIRFEVDINTARWPELSQLPEIGETLARRIVESRQKEGPFLDHEDLMRVRGIGPKTLEQIRPHLRPMPDRDALAGR